MSRSTQRSSCLVVLLAFVACAASAGEAPKGEAKGKAAKEPSAKPSTHTVKKGLFKIEAELKGVFEARNMAEVVFRPKAWQGLVVREAVEQGTPVRAGDVVISLDTKKIDEAIRDTEADQSLSDLAFRLMQEETAALEKSVPLDLTLAERTSRHAEEDLKRYVEVDRELSVKQTRQSLKNSENYLAYQKEELRQLEKMYEADDLTEETEEIILKRQRDAVKRMELGLEVRRAETDKALSIALPRRDVSVKENARRQALALEKARATMPMSLRKKRLEIEKTERSRRKSAEKLAKLKSDREAMIARSPVDGIVYYGRCVRGNWPGLTMSLARGTALKPHAVAMTVVEPRPMFVRASVPEKLLSRLRPFLEGKAIPAAYPDVRLKARVEQVSAAPVAAGKFEARISFADADAAVPLVPGMNCTVKLVSYSKADALTVPASAVFSDELDEERKFVNVRKKDGGHEKRFVSVGKKTDKKAEILEGLGEGDVVLLKKPKESK